MDELPGIGKFRLLTISEASQETGLPMGRLYTLAQQKAPIFVRVPGSPLLISMAKYQQWINDGCPMPEGCDA